LKAEELKLKEALREKESLLQQLKKAKMQSSMIA